MERKHIKYAFIGALLIISGVVFAFFSHGISFLVSHEQNKFLEERNIQMERFEVMMDDGVHIKGLSYVNESQLELKDKSVPTILLIHGINGRKENFKNKIFNLVHRGYAVFSVEQRGHGESEGLSGFIGKEPYDMIEVINYISENYPFADTSKLGLLCFSFGGGIGLVLQALDERVHCAVVYHPLSSLEHITDEIPFETLIGRTRAIEDLNVIDDAFKVCTPENTLNTLLIQGSADKIINPQDTYDLYAQLNGASRTDVSLEVREGVSHPQNEQDKTSFKHALLWFEHYYHDPSLDIDNRQVEINKILLIEYDWLESPFPDALILLAAFSMFLGLSIILLPIFIWPLYFKHYSSLEKVQKSYDIDEVEERYDYTKLFTSSVSYNRMLFLRSFLYVLGTIIGVSLCVTFDWGILYGYFIFIPLMTLVFMAFVPKAEHPQWKYEWKHEWNDWYRNHIIVIAISVQTIIIPIVMYLFIFNNNAFLMRTAPIPWFTSTTIIYFMIAASLILSDSMLIRGWKFKHTAFLAVLRPITLLIFNAFIPMPIFADYGGLFLTILFMATIGLAVWGLINLFDSIARTYKSRVTAVMIFLLPLDIMLIHWFFRIV